MKNGLLFPLCCTQIVVLKEPRHRFTGRFYVHGKRLVKMKVRVSDVFFSLFFLWSPQDRFFLRGFQMANFKNNLRLATQKATLLTVKSKHDLQSCIADNTFVRIGYTISFRQGVNTKRGERSTPSRIHIFTCPNKLNCDGVAYLNNSPRYNFEYRVYSLAV